MNRAPANGFGAMVGNVIGVLLCLSLIFGALALVRWTFGLAFPETRC